ncbi:site-specific integrase [uncultured Treponema sp.]|uniref:tyrosine-type recombinase/integrase n=1 Tax=uncultured Treponema sp. TaxID=162155 RepID=UPI001DD3F6A4|nr:site-specific integrase [uncultured Treponema sp.]MBS7267077.1 site-specific integrase [Treponema sp.]
MQPFYLAKNSSGYYKVCFVNTETGKVTNTKSTHSKNKFEANMIASSWVTKGAPEKRTSPSRAFNLQQADSSSIDLNSVAQRLTREEASLLIDLLNKRFNFVSSADCLNTIPNNSVNLVPNVQSANAEKVSDSTKPIFLIETLSNFWDFENSEYVKKRIARGYDIKQRNCKEKLGIVKRYWAKYFDADRTVQSLTSRELDDFLMYLRIEKNLSADTVNKTMTAGNMAFEFLIKEGLITSNPLTSVERFKVNAKKRGIPTETEMKKLMELNWDWTDSVNKLAFKVAALFGLRAGEISGLQVCDIDANADLLYIRHSWNDTDKLKDTKNGDDRIIPIEHGVALELLMNARRNPDYSDTSFVFWSPKVAGQPMWPSSFEDDFYIAMQKIGISEEQRKERNIVFHSLRHYCATQIAQRASLEIAMKILGHRTEEMTRLYSEHETQMKLNNAKEVLAQGWNVLIAA